MIFSERRKFRNFYFRNCVHKILILDSSKREYNTTLNMLAAWNSLETTRFRITDFENSMHFGEGDFPRPLAERSADR